MSKPPVPADAIASVSAALRGAEEGFRFVSVRAPLRPAESLLLALGGSDDDPGLPGLAWLPPEGPQIVSLGAAATVSGSLESAELRGRATELLSSIRAITHEPGRPGAPRLMGGFAFGSGAAMSRAWSGFGGGTLVLPRWTYRREGSGAWLSLAIEGPVSPSERTAAAGELARLLEVLHRSVPVRPLGADAETDTRADVDAGAAADARIAPEEAWGDEAGEADELDGAAHEEFTSRVATILRAIEAGQFSKLVAARCSEIRRADMPAPTRVLETLAHDFPECTSFYFQPRAANRAAATLVGATPEILVRKVATQVSTVALAGSVTPDREDFLLESSKEAREHDIVVEHVTARLEPLCDDVRPAEVRPVRLRDIIHLQTPIEARAKAGIGLLDLVDALHPTPAVGGFPREAAARWIAEHEPLDRGWYAAPFGWLDASGNGEFVVALRCGVLAADRAWLFAGAGIVRGSEPENEWAETESKLTAMRRALRAAAGSTRRSNAGPPKEALA